MDLFDDNIKIEDLATATRLFRESRSVFLKLFNHSPVCMSMTTTTLGRRVYVRVNKSFLDKFGFSETEIIGRSSAEIGILDAEESVRVGEMIREKGCLQNDYVKCFTKGGEIVHTVSSIEMMELNGETHLISFFVDITRIIEQQRIIEQHAQQLEAANRELETFSYSVSHDLRAPLRAIDGFTKILEEDFNELFDAEGKRILGIVQNNAKKMGMLIDDLLDFSRLGKKALLCTDIDMNLLLQEVLNDVHASAAHNTIIKTTALHPVKADHTLIKQVMMNLVSNAVKYSSKKPEPLVEISSEIRDNTVIYTVRDNGDGFDMRYVNKLFGIFQRLHSNDEFEGTGVGLAIVHRIITKHGGSLKAEGEVGKGAAFSFGLPREG